MPQLDANTEHAHVYQRALSQCGAAVVSLSLAGVGTKPFILSFNRLGLFLLHKALCWVWRLLCSSRRQWTRGTRGGSRRRMAMPGADHCPTRDSPLLAHRRGPSGGGCAGSLPPLPTFPAIRPVLSWPFSSSCSLIFIVPSFLVPLTPLVDNHFSPPILKEIMLKTRLLEREEHTDCSRPLPFPASSPSLLPRPPSVPGLPTAHCPPPHRCGAVRHLVGARAHQRLRLGQQERETPERVRGAGAGRSQLNARPGSPGTAATSPLLLSSGLCVSRVPLSGKGVTESESSDCNGVLMLSCIAAIP